MYVYAKLKDVVKRDSRMLFVSLLAITSLEHAVKVFPSRAVYAGQWSEGNYQGVGVYEWPDGSVRRRRTHPRAIA